MSYNVAGAFGSPAILIKDINMTTKTRKKFSETLYQRCDKRGRWAAAKILEKGGFKIEGLDEEVFSHDLVASKGGIDLKVEAEIRDPDCDKGVFEGLINPNGRFRKEGAHVLWRKSPEANTSKFDIIFEFNEDLKLAYLVKKKTIEKYQHTAHTRKCFVEGEWIDDWFLNIPVYECVFIEINPDFSVKRIKLDKTEREKAIDGGFFGKKR